MTTAVDAIKIDDFTVPERLELLARVWDSLLDSSERPPMPDWHRDVLDRRLADADANPDDTIPLERLRDYLDRAGS